MESAQFSEEIDFQKYWLVLKRRWLPATGVFGTVVVLAGLYAFSQEPVYVTGGQLLLKTDESSVLTGVENPTGEIVPLTGDSDPLSTEAEIIRSRPILEKTVEALDLRNEEGELIDPKRLSSGLTVKTVTGTDILSITYESPDPEFSAAVVNKIIEIYIENDIQSNRAEAAAAREFIDEQIPQVETNVAAAEAELRQFKENNKIVSLPEEASAAVGILSNLDNQIAQVQAQLADVTSRSTELRNQLGLNTQEAVTVTSLSQSPGVQQALTVLQEVQSQLEIEQARFQDENPTVINLKEQEANLKRLLQERVTQTIGTQQPVSTGSLQLAEFKQQLTAQLVEAEVERLAVANQLQNLSETRATYKERSNVLPRLEEKQRELERKVAAAQATYEILLTSLQETRVAENQNIGNARVISTALVPENSAGPSKNLPLAAGIFVGTLLAIATAFFLDIIDSSVKTLKEAKELFGYTLLGVIPAYDKAGKTSSLFGDSEATMASVITRELPSSPISEAYHMLQANLKFLSSDKRIKAIVVTSSVPKEGKSEVSANLASAMAQVGRRVLLIDADLRHPVQHHIWGLTNAMGLSNVLVGEVELNAVIQEVMPGLHVLPAGVIPPNPVPLLDSQRMASLMERFSKDYDAIIVDTPPLAGVADTSILGKMADGILLVVRPGVVDYASAKSAKEFLMQSGQNVLGIVANGVALKNEPDSYFYYTRENEKFQASTSLEETAFIQE